MSDDATRHLDENGWPDDPRWPAEWVRCELCHGSGGVCSADTFDNLDVCSRCDGAGELLERR